MRCFLNSESRLVFIVASFLVVSLATASSQRSAACCWCWKSMPIFKTFQRMISFQKFYLSISWPIRNRIPRTLLVWAHFMVVRVVWLYRSIFTCICSCCIHDVYLSPIDSIVNICIQNDCAQLHLKHHQRRIETARHRPPIDPQDRPANLYLFQWFNNSVFPCYFSPRKATPTNEPISTQRKHHLICQYNNKLVLERILCHGTSNMGIMLQ